MEITSELLDTIYNRAKVYAIAKWGHNPDELHLCGDGVLYAVYIDYCCGSRDENTETISPENLTEDLDEVARQRNEKLAEEQRLREIQRKKDDEEREKRAKRDREQQYLKLKKEFENG